MDFLQLAKKRHSVRKFSNQKIEKEKLDLILEAGRIAPTAANYQPQRILVLDSEESLEKLKACTPCHFHAPLALLVCYDTSASWKRSYDNEDTGITDASIVATQMILQATESGIGCTWVAHFDPQLIRTSFGLPDYLVPVALIPMGYPAVDSAPNQTHENRFSLNRTVFFNSFDGISKGKPSEK